MLIEPPTSTVFAPSRTAPYTAFSSFVAAFDIAGKQEANPSSFILSVKMMLEWLSTKHTDDTCSKAATKLENAVYGAVRDGAKTVDVGGSMSTSEFTDEVLRRII